MSDFIIEICHPSLAGAFLILNRAEKEQVNIFATADIWFYAFNTQKAVGTIGISFIHTKIARIKGFFVVPELRHQCVGTMLLKEAMKELKERGKSEITTFATIRSRPLFEKMGFNVEREQSNGITFMRFKDKGNTHGK